MSEYKYGSKLEYPFPFKIPQNWMFLQLCARDWKTMDPTTANGSVEETFDPCLFAACRPSLPAAMYSAILKLSSTNFTVANTSSPRG